MWVNKLSQITFSEIMDFYPAHNRSVYEELKNACQRGCVIPFVGAGLSVFCGYQGWPDVLKRLAGFIYDGKARARVETMIEAGELLQAAQDIKDSYPRMLKELPKIVDYCKIKNCDNDKLYPSAVYVLPYLFRSGLVMTTNFDRVLEETYDRCRSKFGNVVTPYEPDHLAQIRQSNPHCLFKLHGDIGPEVHDIERLIFTRAQYDKAYADDGPLMRELPHWFQNKKLLFLGCSLAMDRTMEVLQQATAKNPGIDHYAILACRPGDIPRRCREMGDLGISPIYYPDGKHEAVRVLLERLLEDTDHAAYEELSRHTKEPLPRSQTAHRFMYDSDYIAFVGREKELARLQEFCRHPGQVSWWAVTGSGGMGKSRLVYEFAKGQEGDGWQVHWLKHNNYSDLPHWLPPTDRCIVVADDVQAHLQTVGDWIVSVSARLRSEKLRIILLERGGRDLGSAEWAEMLQSDSPYDDTIASNCYCPDFLTLGPLSDDELKAIMMDFAKTSGKPLADEGHAERLLQTLKKIDGKLQRPIYALAITDAWCGGNDPTRWNKKQVLEALINRELKFYYERLRNLSEDKISKGIRSELENLLAQSCLGPFLPLDQIPDHVCPKLRKKADKLDMGLPDLLRQIGIVHTITVHIKVGGPIKKRIERTGNIEAVILDCPDLVKEYLVLRQAFEKGQLSLLLPADWENDPWQLSILRRLLLDYPEELAGNKGFWNGFFAGDPQSVLPARMYSNLLFGVTVRVPKIKKQALTRLEQIYKRFYTDEGIAVEYANGLVNLSVKQPLEGCIRTVEALRHLQEQFPKNEELLVQYANGLVNLSAKQAREDCVHTVEALRLLREQHPESRELISKYADGLINLSAAQTPEDRVDTVEKLRHLQEQFPDREELMVKYAEGLFGLSIAHTLESCTDSAEKLRLLRERFPDSEALTVEYAKTLVNLSFVQTSEEDVRESFGQAEEFLAQYPQNTEIQLLFAQTQFNLTLKQEGEALCQTMAQLRKFLLDHPDANRGFQPELDTYLAKHPEHTDRYTALKL